MSTALASLRGNRRTRFCAALLGGSAVLALTAGAALAQGMGEDPLNEMIDLGTLGGNYSYASDVSDNGAVVAGYSRLPGGNYHATRWTENGIQDLGTLGGDYSYAHGVSGDGSTIFGWSYVTGNNNHHAFSHRNGSMADLGTLGGAYSYAYAASYDGAVIVGEAQLENGQERAARWVNGVINNLGTLGGTWSYARDVSADGTVVAGQSNIVSDTTSHAFRWTQAGGMVDLGTLGGSHSYARDLSRDGSTVTGGAYIAGDAAYHAFRWTQAGGMVDLGTLGGDYSYGEALSTNGNVVIGYARLSDTTYHAFRWTQAGGMVDLGTLGGNYSWGEDVSGDGARVVGYSRLSGEDGFYHAFLWTEEEGMVDLGTLGGNYSYASAISEDGSTIVGWSQTDVQGEDSHAFIYRTQMQDYANLIASFGQLAVDVDAAGDQQRNVIDWLTGGACRVDENKQTCVSAAGRLTSSSADTGLGLPNRDSQALRVTATHRMTMQTAIGGGLAFFGVNDPLGAVDPQDGVAVGGWFDWSKDGGRTGPQIHLAVGHASQSVVTSRGLGFANVQVLEGDTDLYTTTLQARWGYGFARDGGVVVTPSVTITHQTTSLDAFEEEPGDYPATFSSTSFDATFASLGAEVEAPVSGGQIRAAAAIDVDISSDPVVLKGISAIPGMNPFTVPSPLSREETRFHAEAQYSHPVGMGLMGVGIGVSKPAVGGPTAFHFGVSFGADF